MIPGGRNEEDVQVESIHVSRRGARPRSEREHEPGSDCGSAGAGPSGGHGPGAYLYAAVDIGAQHGHAGGPDDAVSTAQDHWQHLLRGDPNPEFLPGGYAARKYT